MTKPIYIPPDSKRVSGLHIQCRSCNALADLGICNKTKKAINSNCPGRNTMCYKAVVHVPGTKNGRKTKILKAVQYEEAIAEFLEFKNSFKESTLENIPAPALLPKIPPPEKEKTPGLIALMAKYVGYLHGDNIPSFKKKTRSKGHLDDVERCLKRWVTALHENGHIPSAIRADEVNDDLISELHDYLIDDLEIGNSGYNRSLTILTSFYRYLINEGYCTKNPFLDIPRKAVKESVETIEQDQFERLLEILKKPELGLRPLPNGVRKNFYKSWMPSAVSLALYSGRRRTECVLMKWKDAVYNDGILQHVIVPDYKVNRAKNLPPENWIYRYVPGTAELHNLLEELGKESRNPDDYILAPDEVMSRASMASLMSKSFAHYFSQLGYQKQLSFGCLRRTNFSSLSSAIGMENARTISGHADNKTLKKFYVSQKVLARAAKQHGVFDERKKDEQQRATDDILKPDSDHSIDR